MTTGTEAITGTPMLKVKAAFREESRSLREVGGLLDGLNSVAALVLFSHLITRDGVDPVSEDVTTLWEHSANAPTPVRISYNSPLEIVFMLSGGTVAATIAAGRLVRLFNDVQTLRRNTSDTKLHLRINDRLYEELGSGEFPPQVLRAVQKATTTLPQVAELDTVIDP